MIFTARCPNISGITRWTPEDWFVNFNGLAKPAERPNDFGGVLGGPVRKDKTFFFFSYEGLRLRQPSTHADRRPGRRIAAAGSGRNASVPERISDCRTALRSGRDWRNSTPAFRILPRWTPTASGWITPSTRSSICSAATTTRRPAWYQRGPRFSSGPVLSTTSSSVILRAYRDSRAHELITPGISNEVRANYSNHRIGTKYVMD